MKSFFSVKNLSKTYIGGYNAINDISFELNKGEKIIILGEYASGKTTILSIIAGLENATDGEMYLNDKCINNTKIIDRNIGYIDKSLQLSNFKVVKDIITYPLKIRKIDNNVIAEKLTKISNTLEISDILNTKTKKLTQYQKTLVAIARLFICSRELYLIDDIFDNLSFNEVNLLVEKIQKLMVDKSIIFAVSSYQTALKLKIDSVLLLGYSTAIGYGNIHNKEIFANTLVGYKYLNNKKICSIPISFDNNNITIQDKKFSNNFTLKSNVFDRGLLALTMDKIAFDNSKEVVITSEIYYKNKYDIGYLDINAEIATIFLDNYYKEGDVVTFSFNISDAILYDFESERMIST